MLDFEEMSRKKAGRFVWQIKAPWDLYDESRLCLWERRKKYKPRWNDDILNTCKHDISMMWRGDLYWKHVLSNHVIINYIEKYETQFGKGWGVPQDVDVWHFSWDWCVALLLESKWTINTCIH